MMTTFRFEDYEPDQRDEILHRAHEGHLTPEQAEAEAAKAGVGPLAKEPAGVDFDPIAEPYWTLAMSLAWVIWREPGKVRDYWNAYRRERQVWRYREYRLPPDGQVQRGWYLEQPKAVSMHEVWRDEAARAPKDAKPRATTAQDELWKMLATGKLTASGICRDQRSRIQIPAYEWIDLSPINYFEGYEDAVGSHTGGPPRFEAVRIPRSEIEAIWPPPSIVKNEGDCKAFLIARFRASPTRRLQSNDELWAEAKAKFPHLSRNQFTRAKATAIAEAQAFAWGKAGAPKKSNRRTK
jgi:hypothetical protein